MAYQGVVSSAQVTDRLNNVHFDVKAAVRIAQSDIRQLISDMADPAKTFLVVDGRKIYKSDATTLQIAVTNKLDELSNQTTTILSVFSELYKLEKSLGGLTS